MIGDIRQKTTV